MRKGIDIGAANVEDCGLPFNDEDGIAIKLWEDNVAVKKVHLAGYPEPRVPITLHDWAARAFPWTWLLYLRSISSIHQRMIVKSKGRVVRKERDTVGYTCWTDEGDSGSPLLHSIKMADPDKHDKVSGMCA